MSSLSLPLAERRVGRVCLQDPKIKRIYIYKRDTTFEGLDEEDGSEC